MHLARLMCDLGLQGVIRGKPVRTTINDTVAPCPLDHVNRHFHAPAPNTGANNLRPSLSPSSRPFQAVEYITLELLFGSTTAIASANSRP
jgi:hypothetical protein